MATDEFVVTREWLEAYPTLRGGYTRKQIELLGVKWPPRRGWKRRLRKCITVDAQAAFEKASGQQEGYALLTTNDYIPERKRKPKCATRPKPSRVNGDAFLNSFEWRRLRMVVLKKRGLRCECCGAVPTPTNGVVMHVDHVKPRRHFPELALTESNLQVLCEACNHGKGSWDDTDWREDSSQPVVAVPKPVQEPRMVAKPFWAGHAGTFKH